MGVDSESGVSHSKETPDSGLAICLIWIFLAVYLTFVQFILQLKLCLYTIVHLLLEAFKNLSQVILKYTITMSHNIQLYSPERQRTQ